MYIHVARLGTGKYSFHEVERSIPVPDVRERIDHLMVRVVCADRERRAEKNPRRFVLLVELLALFQVDEDRGVASNRLL